jgi:putative flippase GtrA
MPKFVTYVLIGAISAAIDLLTLSLLIEAGIKQLPAISIAFAAGFIFNIKMHSVFTFNSHLNIKSSLRFTAVVAINCILTLIIIEALTTFSLDLFIAKVVSLPIIAVSGFLLGRQWAFRP